MAHNTDADRRKVREAFNRLCAPGITQILLTDTAQPVEIQAEVRAPIPGKPAKVTSLLVDKRHAEHMRLFDQVIRQGKLDAWIAEHEFSRTTVTNYRGGRIAGKISESKRAAIEQAIRTSAKALGLN